MLSLADYASYVRRSSTAYGRMSATLEMISSAGRDGPVASPSTSTGLRRPRLDAARSCLAIGPCVGLAELEFVECLMPNLRALTVVDADSGSAAATETRRSMRQHLQRVSVDIRRQTFDEYRASAAVAALTYDVVLFFHADFYHVGDRDDQLVPLFRSIHDELLNGNGYAVIGLHGAGSDRPDDLRRIVEQLDGAADSDAPSSAAMMMEEFDVEAEMTSVGFVLDRRYRYEHGQDFSNSDDGLLRFFCALLKKEITVDELRSAVRRVWPREKTDHSFATLLVFRKSIVC